MKKTVSLMPKKAKKKKEISAIKRYGALFVSIPVIISMYNMGTNVLKTEELERLKENQSMATTVKGKISEKQAEIQNNEGIIRSLELSGVPLNKFMLFMGTETPDDIRIYEIRKGIAEQATTTTTDTTGGTQGNLSPGGNPNGTPGEQRSQAPGESAVPSEAIPEAQPMEQTGVVDGITTGIQNVINEIDSNEQKIVIKGAGLKVDSVAKLVEGLKINNPYISDIKISDIQNYKNEEFNYKMFEMEIYIR